MTDHAKFPVEILTPEGEVFNDEVEMLSTRTTVGEIGVLARHAPLMTLVNHAELRLHMGGDKVIRYAQGQGYLQVADNHAMVLIAEAIPPAELDVEELKQQLADSEQRLKSLEAGSAEAAPAEHDRSRAEAFLRIAGA